MVHRHKRRAFNNWDRNGITQDLKEMGATLIKWQRVTLINADYWTLSELHDQVNKTADHIAHEQDVLLTKGHHSGNPWAKANSNSGE